MKTGPLTPLGDIKGDTWERIYDVTLTEAATSLTISGLNGDVDEEYILESKVVNGYNGACNVIIRSNNDTGSNYGCQWITGQTTSSTAGRAVYNWLSILTNPNALGRICMADTLIHAKSGYIRTALATRCSDINGTSVDMITLFGSSWNNTADNITSLVIAATQTGGIGVGSSFQLYRKTRRS